jgi:hypothetical protein
VEWQTDSAALVYDRLRHMPSVVAGVLTGFLAHDTSPGIAASGPAVVLSCIRGSSYVAVPVVGMHASGYPTYFVIDIFSYHSG